MKESVYQFKPNDQGVSFPLGMGCSRYDNCFDCPRYKEGLDCNFSPGNKKKPDNDIKWLSNKGNGLKVGTYYLSD